MRLKIRWIRLQNYVCHKNLYTKVHLKISNNHDFLEVKNDQAQNTKISPKKHGWDEKSKTAY